MTRLFSGRTRWALLAVVLVAAALLAASIVVAQAADLRRASAAASADAAAQPVVQPLTGPWVVAIQPGHWKVAELPDELWRLRTSTGAEYGSVREVDVNVAVANALVERVNAAGWTAELVPATVPPGMRADAFIALHADWGATADRRGWKLSPPWRSSPASKALASALSAAFTAETNLVHDADGVTVNMRGYFAFNPRRFEHAASEFTPDVIIEMGFVTNAEDRTLLTKQPDYFAGVIMNGLQHYFAGRDRSRTDDLAPMQLPWVSAGPTGADVRRSPSDGGALVTHLDSGTSLMPVDEDGNWYEVFLRRTWGTGWVRKDELIQSTDPGRPFEPFNGNAGSP